MKTLFISAKSKAKFKLPKFEKLPKNLAIAYSIQFQKQAQEIKKILEKNHKITFFNQVLGCSLLNFSQNTEGVLLIGQGKFHATGLAIETKLPVYILEQNKISKISKKEIEILSKKQKGAYLKFLHAEKIGILVSTKPGQQNLKAAIKFQNKLQSSGAKKDSYLFIANDLDIAEFENFPQIRSWVNTSCRRMDMASSSIINLDKIPK
ncbi:hypothetical protein HN832_02505 [archaeon]|jgi:2-(3-amino-3-carboxypropyl)histidine synthase|nr:hypothetical protein [archaeon]MBT4373225.1 hypothetical protein [archaeon]MBT4531570.1 hypothetical protein [archaeon]MBT7001252.1 hypothetical protein [archaeon]MBT7282262.1 hypothetical protein [archaeon]